VKRTNLSTIARKFLREAIQIRKDWFNVTNYLEQYIVGDDIREKQTNIDSLSDNSYAEIVLANDAFDGKFEKPLMQWIIKSIRTNRYPELIDEAMPKEDRKKFARELYDIIQGAFVEKERERMEEPLQETTTPDERKEAQKEYYKSLPLEKLRDIGRSLNKKSQMYKDLGYKVPKQITSQKRTLYYIVKNKEQKDNLL
jgi:hypothetical protein